jgi:hypothetical protein
MQEQVLEMKEENDKLQKLTLELREEILYLQSLLFSHAHCDGARNNGMNGNEAIFNTVDLF